MDVHTDAGRTTRTSRRARGRRRGNGAAPRRPKGSVQDRVHAELRRWLMAGRFLPGESITLRALAQLP